MPGSTSPMDARNETTGGGLPLPVAMLLVFGVALAIRVFCLWEVGTSVLGIALVGDGRQYDVWAREIAAGNWLGNEIFYQAPLYPYFLAVIYTLFGMFLVAVRIVQVVVGSAACALLAWAGAAFFSRRVGLLAGIFLAVYPPQIFFDLILQKSVLDTFFLCGLLATLGQFQLDRRVSWLPLAGVFFGALTLTRENALVLVVVIVPWLLIHPPAKVLYRVVAATLFVLGAAVCLAPVALRNYAVGGELVLTTAQLGPNFYIGNNPNADGGYLPLRAGRGDPRYERQDATELAEEALGRKLAPGEVSRYWLDRSLEYIRTQPGDWLALLGQKWFLVWGASEIVDTEGLEGYQDVSRGLDWLGAVLHFGVLCPLAAFGVVVTSRQWRTLWLLYGFLVAIAISVTLFYVFGRYRASLIPPLVLFAAAGIFPVEGWRSVKWRAVAGLLVAVGVAVYVNQPTGMTATNRSVTYYAHGKALLLAGHRAEAEICLMRALESRADIPDIHKLLASIRIQEGKSDAALEHLQEAVTLSPKDAGALNTVGLLMLGEGRYAQSANYFRRALDLVPNQPDLAANLGSALLGQGNYEGALTYLQVAEKAQPDQSTPKAALAEAWIGLENLTKARPLVEDALRIDPKNAEAHLTRAELELAEGKSSAAMAELTTAVGLKPGLFRARERMAAIQLAAGDTEKAIRELQTLLHANPRWCPAIARLAEIYVTVEDARYRNPPLGLRYATELVKRDPTPAHHELLATALAANDRYEEAVRVIDEAIDLAKKEKNETLVSQLLQRRAQYEAKIPKRRPAADGKEK